MTQSSTVRKVSSGLAYNFLKVLVTVSIGFLYNIIVVRSLRVDSIGTFAFLTGIFGLVAFVYGFMAEFALARFLPELIARNDLERSRKLIRVTQYTTLLSATLAFSFFFLAADQLARSLGQPDLGLYMKLMSLSVVPLALVNNTKAILTASYDQKFLGLMTVAGSTASLLAVFVLVVLLGLGLFGVIVVSVISAFLVLPVFYLRVRTGYSSLIQGRIESLGPVLRSRIVKYGLPLALLNLFTFFVSKPTEDIFLGLFRTLNEVAYYDVPYTFLQTVLGEVWIIIGGLGLVSIVEIRTRNPGRLNLALQQYVKLISLYTIPVTAGGIVLAEPIMTSFYGTKLLPAAFPFQLLSITLCFVTIFSINGVVLQAFERTSYMLKWSGAQAALLIILDLALIPTWGVTGAILSTSVAFFVGIVFFSWEVMRKLGVGNYLPLSALTKYVTASVAMGLYLIGISRLYVADSIRDLLVLVTSGAIVYMVGLKLLRAFDENDRELLLRSQIPKKGLVARLLFG